MLRASVLIIGAGILTGCGMLGFQSTEEEKAIFASDAEVAKLVEGNNEFAFDLYRQLSKKEGNLIFSPYSISTALAMTYAGARGETAEQMAKVLHFAMGQEGTHPAFAQLKIELADANESKLFQLDQANALWGQQGLPFRKPFLQTTSKFYDGGLKEVDYAGKPQEARRTINNWVEKQTKNRIRELLEPSDVNPITRLILTNAVYFKSSWKDRFKKELTEPGLFHIHPGNTVIVPMMQAVDRRCNYAQFGGFQIVELPYKGDRLSMYVFLPEAERTLEQLEGALSAAKVEAAIAKLKRHEGTLSLPRFKVTLRFRLNKELSTLGMPIAFSSQGDFSGITSAGSLQLAAVLHKAFIQVNETGTEAAAATAVRFGDGAYPRFSFRADRPFLFLIRDNRSKTVLFIGRVTEPGPK